MNFLLDEGGFEYDSTAKKFRVNFDKIKAAVTKLTSVILTIQAEGSKVKAKELLDKYGVMRDNVKQVLDTMKDIAVDIAPAQSKIGIYFGIMYHCSYDHEFW